MKPTLIIADDHPIFRRGLRDIIESSDDFIVLEEFEDGSAAWEYIRDRLPDIAILDIEMPGLRGLDIARNITAERLPVKVMILTMFDDAALLNSAMHHGALGYILKDTAIAEVMRGLDNVRHGNTFISTRLLDKVVNRGHNAALAAGERVGLEALTPTEREVLVHISENRSTREIAACMFISVRTVENHRARITKKLGLSGSYALLRFALEQHGKLI